jgi:DNA polymerase (family 10)
MENTRISELLDEIADLLELQGANAFRVRSYRSAAQTIRAMSVSLQSLVGQGKDLTELPHVGKSIAAKVREILRTGTCKRLEEVRKEIPEALNELLDVPGLGPKTAMHLHEALGIDNLEELRKACENKQIESVEGLGKKSEEKILDGIRMLDQIAGRILYYEADQQVHVLGKYLDTLNVIKQWQVAGSFRRKRETIGDLDVLIQADNRENAAEAILEYKEVAECLNQGEERMSVTLRSGLQIDFRFFLPDAFGAAMLYFTGSKAHNIELRSRAQRSKWKLNEYGLYEGKKRLAGTTEQDVYKQLNLSWIPPELRQGNGEIEAAADDQLPALITLDDVKGDLQCHSTASDGENTVREMAKSARAMGYEYLAITDHSKRVTMANGLDDDRVKKHLQHIREVDADMDDFWVLAGVEVDILRDGTLDLEAETLRELDWVVGSIHYDRELGRDAMTERYVAAAESGLINTIGHPLGRMIGKRDVIPLDFDKLFQACLNTGVCLEINAQPERLDLPDSVARNALAAGVEFSLGTDAHVRDNLNLMRFGINTARRAWLEPENVINTYSAKELADRIA